MMALRPSPLTAARGQWEALEEMGAKKLTRSLAVSKHEPVHLRTLEFLNNFQGDRVGASESCVAAALSAFSSHGRCSQPANFRAPDAQPSLIPSHHATLLSPASRHDHHHS